MNLKELKKHLSDCQASLDQKQSIYQRFQTRQDTAIRSLQEKHFTLERLEKDRDDLLEKVTSGARKEEDLFRIGKDIEILRLEIRDLEDLLLAFPKTKDSLEVEIRKLQKEVEGAYHNFWFQIMIEEKRKAAGNEPFLRSWAALTLSGVSISFGQFLAIHFANYGIADLQKIQGDLRREYEGGETING
jgi:hypothetical protein